MFLISLIILFIIIAGLIAMVLNHLHIYYDQQPIEQSTEFGPFLQSD